MRIFLSLILLLAASIGQAADFVGSVAASNATGRLVAPTNFFFGNLWAGSNVVLEITNRTGVRFHVPLIDQAWTNNAGKIYPPIDRPRIEFTTNLILGRAMRADGTNTALGTNALPLTSGSKNTAVGSDALSLTTSTDNSAFGYRAGVSNSSGGFNTAIGSRAMEYNRFRSDNLAVGYQALQQFITGFENTAIGPGGPMSLVGSAFDSTAVGYSALDRTEGTGNTAIGSDAMQNSSGGGQYAVGVGFEALLNSGQQDGTVAIGRAALSGVTGLTNVVAVGYQASATAGGITNSVAIGANSRITANNQMMLGTNITDYVLRNLGYTAPSAYGSAGAALTNNGSGAVGWSILQFQPANANLTNWSLIPTGSMANVVSTDYLTNWANSISNLVQTKPSFSSLVWTSALGSFYPKDFPTNVIFNPTNNAAASSVLGGNLTNFIFTTSVRRTGGTNHLFSVNNGGASAFTVGDQGIMIGSTNFILVPQMAIDVAYDTAFGVDTPDKTITMSSYNSDVGYSGNTEFGVGTNYGRLQLLANKEGNGQIQLDARVGDAGFTNFDLTLLVINDQNTFIIPWQVDPDFSLSPTGYIFGSSQRITNTHTLMSLQNSNTPVFEVNGIGDLKLLKRVAYSWPSSQGSQGTALTNDGSGNLGWGFFQPASANLTNWSLIPTGAMANVVSATFLTNWANSISNLTQTKQNGSAVLTNISATGAITNLNANQFGDLTTIATIKNLARLTNINFWGMTNIGDFTNDGKIFSTGTFTNGGAVNILGGVTNWAGVETRGNATNAGWLDIVGGFTNNGAALTVGSITNGGRMDTAGGVTNWIQSETKGTLYASSNLLIKAGQSTSNAWGGGIIFRSNTSFTNLNGAGTMSNLANVSIPAHFMTNSGDMVYARWGGTMPTATPNTNQFQIVFGSTTILDTGLMTASNTTFNAEVWITRTGNTAQHAEGRFEWGPGGGVPFAFTNSNAETVETNGIATVLALKGGSRRVGAHTNNSFRVYYEPGPN